MSGFLSESVPPARVRVLFHPLTAQASKKQFDRVRQGLDQVNIKCAKSAAKTAEVS